MFSQKHILKSKTMSFQIKSNWHKTTVFKNEQKFSKIRMIFRKTEIVL